MTKIFTIALFSFLATVISSVVIPTAARATDDCFAKPALVASNEGRWHYRTNSATHEKCWFLVSEKASASNVALPWISNAENSSEPATRPAVEGCLAAPDGLAPRGMRWYYLGDKATGKRCWRLSNRGFKVNNPSLHN
jgi:hypothetical protein